MSLQNPDARSDAIGRRLKPLGVAAVIIGLGSAPVLAYGYGLLGAPDNLAAALILTYVLISTAAGIFTDYVPGVHSPLTIAAYWIAYGAGLFLILGSTTPVRPGSSISQGLVGSLAVYAVAAFLVFLHVRRIRARQLTTARGVDTTATITRAGVDGMINYVQHQRLTLKFTDQQGHDRWFRIGRTGGGYQVGDTLPIRYDPERPGLKRAIIVGN